MTWKSYAAVSGATVLAGWLASSPPSNATRSGAAGRAQPSPARGAAASDIAHEAERLQERPRRPATYAEPQRNPFRFGTPASSGAAAAIPVPPSGDSSGPVRPMPPPLRLSGIAADAVDERTVRTAILSSPAGVLLVREGDIVLGEYRVARIEPEAVELVNIADGSILRLSL